MQAMGGQHRERKARGASRARAYDASTKPLQSSMRARVHMGCQKQNREICSRVQLPEFVCNSRPERLLALGPRRVTIPAILFLF